MQDMLFPVGRQVVGADLVGREPAMSDLGRRLMAGEHVVLAGPRRIGKTSVALATLDRLAAQGLLTANVDCMRIGSMSELAQAVGQAVLANVARTERAVADVAAWLRGATASIEWRSAFGPDAELALSLTLPDKVAHLEPHERLEHSLEGIERLAARKDRRFVFMFDEFQELGRIDRTLLGRMRAVMVRQSHVSYLFLGSQRSTIEALFVRGKEPFYRFAVPWLLPPVPSELWRAYMATRLSDRGYTPQPAALDDLLTRTGAHPMDTMMLAGEAALSADTLGTLVIGLDVVALATDRVMASLERAFEETWRQLDVASQHVLRRLCREEGPYRRPAPNHQSIHTAIAKLLDAGILSRGAARGRYQFVEPLFAAHVRMHYLT